RRVAAPSERGPGRRQVRRRTRRRRLLVGAAPAAPAALVPVPAPDPGSPRHEERRAGGAALGSCAHAQARRQKAEAVVWCAVVPDDATDPRAALGGGRRAAELPR